MYAFFYKKHFYLQCQAQICNTSKDKTFKRQALQNGQTYSNSSSVVADELFECVDHFVGLALRERKLQLNNK